MKTAEEGRTASVFCWTELCHLREYCRWIAEVKKKETQLKRLEKAIEMLRNGVRTP